MYLFLTGGALLSVILGLFWLMDRLESPLLARVAYSGLGCPPGGGWCRLCGAGASADAV